ncbi:MAG: FAD-binding oxidoreductase, partial [Anaerolineales bacterium]
MKTVPLWTDLYPRPNDIPISPLPEKVDVAIIGSGYTGLNAALVLADSSSEVAVLEQETIGWGASSRNGSMLTTGLKAPIKWVMKRYGREAAHHFWSWSLKAIDHVQAVIEKEKIACEFSRPGHAYLAYK